MPSRLVDDACFEFAKRIPGQLEVAMGLETVHPQALAAPPQDAQASPTSPRGGSPARGDIGVRAFVLVGTPFVPADESVVWAVRSAAWALEQGASVVALIPVRGGNGELERLAASGAFTPPTLRDLEAALEGALTPGPGRGRCRPLGRGAPGGLPGVPSPRGPLRLARMSLTGRIERAVLCDAV